MKQLKIIVRSLKKNSILNVINLFSMALGLVAAGIILAYVYQEYHYDAGNAKSENIFRVEPSGYGPLAQTLKTNLPEIKETTRVSFFYGYLACSAGENKFNETCAIFADPTFFDLFSFPVVKGNKKECLNTSNSVALSETAAHKYFGDSDPIGKTLKIGSKSEFTVEAIYKDF
nr:ABC transporter permease [Prolixibacteraceae bacterium]